MKIIAITNQKGGVGKTTTSVNLAAGLAYLGKRVLLVDIDPQANATQGIGIDRSQLKYTVYDALCNDVSLREIIKHTNVERLDVVPASIDLAGVEIELAALKTSRETKLKDKLNEVKNNYDFVLIDCPPALGLLNTNALTASDSVLIPVQCEYFALEGLTQLLNTITLTKKVFNPKLTIEGVLLTMLDESTNLGEEVSQEVRKYFKEKVYEQAIPRNIKLGEAPSRGLNIFDYDPRCKGAYAYARLAREVVERNG